MTVNLPTLPPPQLSIVVNERRPSYSDRLIITVQNTENGSLVLIKNLFLGETREERNMGGKCFSEK